MADDEVIANPKIKVEFDQAALEKSGAQAVAATGAALTKQERLIAAEQRKLAQLADRETKAIQASIDRINSTKATAQLTIVEKAVEKMGGVAKLSGSQIEQLRKQVEGLAAAGAKVPKSLQGIPAAGGGGIGKALGAAGASAAGAFPAAGPIGAGLSALGPAGIAAAAGIGAVTAAATAAGAAIVELAAKAEGWTNTAAATGLGVVQVQQLGDFLEDAGFQADDLETIMKGLQREIGGGGDNLAKFGIEVANLKGLAPEAQLQEVARQVANIADPTLRAAAAMAAFGKSGAEHLAAIQGIAAGAYKELGALTEAQVKHLAEVDAKLDSAARTWKNWAKTATVAILDVAEASVNMMFNPAGLKAAPKAPPLPAGTKFAASEFLDKSPLFSGNEWEEIKKKAEPARKLQEEADKKAADAARDRAIREEVIARALDGQLKTMYDQENAAADLAALEVKRREELDAEIEKARVARAFAGRLKEGDRMGLGEGIFVRDPQVLKDLQKNEGGTKKVAKATYDWAQQLQNVANIMTSMGGKAGSFFGSLAGGISGIGATLKNAGGLSGIKGMFSKAGGGGGLTGILGGIGAAGSIAQAAIGIGTAIVGLFKKDPIKEAQKKVGKALGHGISRELAETLLADSKATGKSIEQVAKDYEAKARAEQAKANQENLAGGVAIARSGAETLLGVFDQLNAKAQGFATPIIQAVQDALVANGLGFLATGQLAQSEAFSAVQTAVGGIAQVLQGMRQAGGIDQALLANVGGAAGALRGQATEAALAAGLTPEEAQKAGMAAIAPLLREALNASVASGKELDENTKALLAEAKANGIDIVADPILQQLDVQKQQLAVLQQIAGGGGGGGAGGPEPSRGLAGGYGGWVNSPTNFTVGEAGREFLAVLPSGADVASLVGGRGAGGGGAAAPMAGPNVYAPVINVRVETNPMIPPQTMDEVAAAVTEKVNANIANHGSTFQTTKRALAESA